MFLGGILLGYVWLFVAATSPLLPQAASPIHFYSNQSRQDIKLIFCSALDQAKKSIYVMMYGITDPEVIRILAQKAAAGIDVEVHYDKSASSNLTLKLQALAQPFTSKGLMHRKILVIDRQLVFLGSANLTTASLRHHDNLVVGLYSPALANFLQEDSGSHFSFEIDGKAAELWLLPDKKQSALDRLLTSIEQAKKTIQIAMFTLTHSQIAEALIQAQRRGVAVQVAIDYYTARGASRSIVAKLKQNGVPVLLSQGQELLHHKWAWIDGQILVLGSANWTRAAFAKNEDFLLFLYHMDKPQKKFLDRLWKTIERESF